MKKITSLFAVSALALTFAATGCKKKEGENKEPAMKPEEKGSGEATKPADGSAAKTDDKGSAAAPTPAAGGGDVPAECADYKAQMEKLMGCEKAKDAAAGMKAGFDQTWKALESAPAEAKAAMGAGCKSAADSIKTTITSMGC